MDIPLLKQNWNIEYYTEKYYNLAQTFLLNE